MKKYLFVISITLLCQNHIVWAHGVSGRILTNKKPIGLEFIYSTGDVAPYANIEVYSPDDHTIEYQNARTDQHGYFAFIPNKPGDWTVIMSDNMGHRTETILTFTEEDLLPQDSYNVVSTSPDTELYLLKDIPMWLRATLGISLLLNIFVGLFVILQYRKNCHAHK